MDRTTLLYITCDGGQCRNLCGDSVSVHVAITIITDQEHSTEIESAVV